MAVTGLAPLGGLMGGLMADQFGAGVTLRVAGLACVVISLAFASQYPRLRAEALPVYIRKGIVKAPILELASVEG